jgi:hypothetical protein
MTALTKFKKWLYRWQFAIQHDRLPRHQAAFFIQPDGRVYCGICGKEYKG